MSTLPVRFRYDAAADVLYVELGHGEVSVTDEIDETLLVDVGYQTGSVTGFTILGPRKKKLTVKLIVQSIFPKISQFAGNRRQGRELLTRLKSGAGELERALSVVETR